MQDKSIYTLKIQDLSPEGRGIARLPMGTSEMVVFVSNALPGQVVKAEILKRKSNFFEARSLEIIDKAKSLPPLCPHHLQCGGCPLQTLPYEAQLQTKTKLLSATLMNQAKLKAEDLAKVLDPILASPQICGYRNKIEWAFGSHPKSKKTILGQREAKSSQVILTEDCMLFKAKAKPIIYALGKEVASSDLPPFTLELNNRKPHGQGFWRFFILRETRDENDSSLKWLAQIITSKASAKERKIVAKIALKLLQEFKSLKAIVHEERLSCDRLSQGQNRLQIFAQKGQDSNIMLPLGGQSFLMDPAAFFQVNLSAAEILVSSLQKKLKPYLKPASTLLDLYCGVGVWGLLLAHFFDQVVGVEVNPKASASAQNNAKRLGYKHCSFFCGLAEQKLGLQGQVSTVILDPPRSGLQNATLKHLFNLKPETILYVSCNPQTLARDLKLMLTQYELQSITPIDFFPHTIHLETLTLLTMK
ncbi:MAG: 23S rRNA (uracil(1939)-C(5))-methyltransferase RlmD [Desulfovibrionaceae bacterium]|nr:23S rRNA (uracil(1939)-C(5))-methyltransferase RlmD [Desulfovibrionaceae bacterium]